MTAEEMNKIMAHVAEFSRGREAEIAARHQEILEEVRNEGLTEEEFLEHRRQFHERRAMMRARRGDS